MTLKIDDELDAQIRSLAALLRKSPEAAVRVAVEEKLAAARRDEEMTPEERLERLRAISKRAGAKVRGRIRSEDHADLYGEDGLPQ